MAENEPVQRWAAKRRTALVVSILKGEISTNEAARKHGLTIAAMTVTIDSPMAAHPGRSWGQGTQQKVL